MKTKFFALIISMILVATILSGCGESDDTKVVGEINQIVNDTSEKNGDVNMSQFIFTTADIDGNEVKIEDFSDAKLIMVNFWEPWCGPCVKEMPELEKIYEEYSNDGLVILGIFSTTDMKEEVRKVMESSGTTYPILEYTDSMKPFITDYVPATIFLDGDGNVLSSEPVAGSNSYKGWKQIIEEYMKQVVTNNRN